MAKVANSLSDLARETTAEEAIIDQVETKMAKEIKTITSLEGGVKTIHLRPPHRTTMAQVRCKAKLTQRTSGITLVSTRCSKMNKIDRIVKSIVASSSLSNSRSSSSLRMAGNLAKGVGANMAEVLVEQI